MLRRGGGRHCTNKSLQQKLYTQAGASRLVTLRASERTSALLICFVILVLVTMRQLDLCTKMRDNFAQTQLCLALALGYVFNFAHHHSVRGCTVWRTCARTHTQISPLRCFCATVSCETSNAHHPVSSRQLTVPYAASAQTMRNERRCL